MSDHGPRKRRHSDAASEDLDNPSLVDKRHEVVLRYPRLLLSGNNHEHLLTGVRLVIHLARGRDYDASLIDWDGTEWDPLGGREPVVQFFYKNEPCATPPKLLSEFRRKWDPRRSRSGTQLEATADRSKALQRGMATSLNKLYKDRAAHFWPWKGIADVVEEMPAHLLPPRTRPSHLRQGPSASERATTAYIKTEGRSVEDDDVGFSDDCGFPLSATLHLLYGNHIWTLTPRARESGYHKVFVVAHTQFPGLSEIDGNEVIIEGETHLTVRLLELHFAWTLFVAAAWDL